MHDEKESLVGPVAAGTDPYRPPRPAARGPARRDGRGASPGTAWLDRPADREAIEALAEGGHLFDRAAAEALGWLRRRMDWWRWTSAMLLCIGWALVLSGVVYFFAFNWARLSPVAKFGILEAALVAAVVAGARLGLETLAGRTALMTACVIVGVLLAVYGQVYQTGADTAELFAGWAALITGWAIVARSAGVWFLWLVLVNLALALSPIPPLWGGSSGASLLPWLLLGLLDVAALALREWAVLQGARWLYGRWHRWAVCTAALVFLLLPALAFLLEPVRSGWVGLAGLAALLLVICGGYVVYRYVVPDLPALTLGSMALCAVVLTLWGRLTLERASGGGALIMMAIAILGVVSVAVVWLRDVAGSLEGGCHA